MFSQLRLFLLPLLLMLLLAQAEKGLFVLYHARQFSELSIGSILYAMLWGIRFDLAIAGFFTFLAYLAAYLAKRVLRREFAAALQHTSFIAAALLLLLHGADMLYYGEAGRHLGYELKEGLNSGGSLALAVASTYTWPVLLQLLLLLPLYWLNRALFRRFALPPPQDRAARHRLGFIRLETALFTVLVISAVMVRGGIASVPLEPLHAQQIGGANRAAIALNGAYNALFSSMTSYEAKPLISGELDSQQQQLIRQWFGPPPAVAGEAKAYNVVLLFLESWSSVYMQSYGYAKDTTPYFDALRKRSLTTDETLAGGHRTTEGLFATLCSWQNPLGETVAQSQLQNYDYDCLPKLLRHSGYATAFFQGTLENTSGTGAFAQALGFEQSYGKRDIKTRQYEENSWGVQDPDLYRFVLDKLDEMPQPFFIGVNTATTHDSRVPESFLQQMGHPDGNGFANAMHFADHALEAFISAYQQSGRFKDTIFVLVADHTGAVNSSVFDRYRIPFLIYAPSVVAPRHIPAISSQRDIAPTVLDILNLPQPGWFAGSSLLWAEPAQIAADYYHEGILGWVQGEHILELPLHSQAPERCYEYSAAQHSKAIVECGSSAEKNIAMAFTLLSQQLLFNGKIKTFETYRGQ